MPLLRGWGFTITLCSEGGKGIVVNPNIFAPSMYFVHYTRIAHWNYTYTVLCSMSRERSSPSQRDECDAFQYFSPSHSLTCTQHGVICTVTRTCFLNSLTTKTFPSPFTFKPTHLTFKREQIKKELYFEFAPKELKKHEIACEKA